MELAQIMATPATGPEPRPRSAAEQGATERMPGQAPAPPPPPLPPPVEPGRYLEVRGAGEALLVRLSPDMTRIGRGQSADLRLDENSVSRRHAIVVDSAEGPRILDDRSSNGTFVNGHRVEQADLKHGDVIVLGRVVLRYLEA
jgi:hypothetical protein